MCLIFGGISPTRQRFLTPKAFMLGDTARQIFWIGQGLPQQGWSSMGPTQAQHIPPLRRNFSDQSPNTAAHIFTPYLLSL